MVDSPVVGRVGFGRLWISGSGFATTTSAPTGTTTLQFRREAKPAFFFAFTPAKGKTTSEQADAFLDLTLIPSSGNVEGFRVELSTEVFRDQLRKLYMQLSRLEPLNFEDPKSPTRQLYSLLFENLTDVLIKEKVSTLLIAADRGLQAVPFAALSNARNLL